MAYPPGHEISPPPEGGRTERHGLSSPIATLNPAAVRRAKSDGVPGGGGVCAPPSPLEEKESRSAPGARIGDAYAGIGSVLMPSQDLAHLGDELVFFDGHLRRAAFAPFLGVLDGRGGLGAFDQVLDLHLALGPLVPAPDTAAGAAP